MDRNILDFNVRLRTIQIKELVIGVILALIVSGILMGIFPAIYDSDDLYFIVILALISVFFIWALFGTTGIGKNFSDIFESNTKKEILYVLVVNLLFAFLFGYLLSAMDIIIGIGDPTWIPIVDGGGIDFDSSAVFYDLIGSIIFAPVLEELMFRGVIFNRLKIRTGIIPAMILSSALFAAGHEFGGITSAFAFGICMCILYLKTDNILVPMAVHFLNNVLASIIYYSNLDIMTASMPWIIPCTIISVLGTVYLIKYIIRETKKLKQIYN